jgi:hypothetical protein
VEQRLKLDVAIALIAIKPNQGLHNFFDYDGFSLKS